VRHELSPASRLPLFALAVAIAAGVVALLFVLDPTPHQAGRHRPSASAPAAVVYSSPSPLSASAPRPAPVAVAVGRRFLRLYVRLQTTTPDVPAVRELRSLSSLALARTLIAQPPQPAGGGHARGELAHLQVEPLSSVAVRLHATIRRGSSLLRVRCLVQRDQDRWTVTALVSNP
jgi:hypothetical protein